MLLHEVAPIPVKGGDGPRREQVTRRPSSARQNAAVGWHDAGTRCHTAGKLTVRPGAAYA